MFLNALRRGLVAWILAGTVGLASGAEAQKDGADAAAAAPAPAPPDAHHLVWVEAVDGLQAGIAFDGSDRRAYSMGETVPLVVKLRNGGARPITLSFPSTRLRHSRPMVEDADGRPARVHMPPAVRYRIPVVKQVLEPGEEMVFDRVRLVLTADTPVGLVKNPHLIARPSKYTVNYTIPLAGTRDPVRTGRLTFVVKAA
jgi:hypothetical protein